MTTGPTRRATLAAAASLVLAPAAQAQVQPQGTDGVSLGEAQFAAPGGPVAGLFGRPAGTGPFPVVLVAEGGGGLGQPISDACHGLAKEGFLAVAPALFAGDPPDGTVYQRLDAARDWAAQNGGDPARLGIVGFGAGGRAAWLYDAANPALKAAVSWYGPLSGPTSPARPTTALEAAAHLHAPMLGLYGKNDDTPRSVLLKAESNAKDAGKTAEIVVYVGAGQRFDVAGTPGYDRAATLDGWKRTLAWLRKNGVG